MDGQPFRLLIFAHSLQGRGTEMGLIRLLRTLDRELVAPILVLASRRGELLDRVPTDIPVYDLGLSEGRTTSAAFRLSRLIRKLRPSGALGVHVSPARLLCLLRVAHPRLRVLVLATDPFARVEREKRLFFLRKWITRLAFKLATKVIVVSDFVRDEHQSELKLKLSHTELIPLPSVDEEVFRLAREPVTEPPFSPSRGTVVVTIGNMYAHKDQTTLLRAFAIVARDVSADLVVIGEGPMRDNLQALAHELSIAESVWFLGFRANPFKYLSASDVYVSPSVSEGFEIAQIEAMACGLPVVVTDAPRYQIVEHGQSGLVVPPGNPEAMASAILELIESPDLARRLTKGGRARALELSAEKVARRYEELITDVVYGRDRKLPPR